MEKEEKKEKRGFSFSGISSFKSCPKSFEYKYIEKLPSAFVSIEAHMGTSVHTVIEQAYKERPAGRETGVEEALEHYKQIFWNSAVLEKTKVIKEGYTATDYFNNGKGFVVFFFTELFPRDKSDTLLLEKRFELPLADGIVFRGIIDRVARDETGTLRVIDFKTGRAPHPLDNLQLPSYAMYIFANNMDNDIQLSIEDLKEQRTVTVPYHRKEIKEVRSALLEDIGKILEAEEFPTRPSILCLWCGYNHICPNPHQAVKSPGGYREPVKPAVSVEEPEGCCPQCGGKLRKRNGKYGPFMGCTNFPQCRYLYNLGEAGAEKKVTAETEGKDICPECGSILKERKGKYGSFIGCTAYPQCRFTRQVEDS